MTIEDEMQNRRGEFAKELESLINRYSQENESDTPDFILAGFLRDCLSAWNSATKGRDQWFGRLSGNGLALLAKTKTRKIMLDPKTDEPHEECPDCRGAGCVEFTNKNQSGEIEGK